MIGAAMRIVKVGVLAPTNKGIPLGVQGENRATQIEFDTRPWFREYPSGTVSAVARRDGDPAPYPLTLDVVDGTAVWNVSDTDTAKAGEGAVELTMTSAGARVRSLTFKTLVTASLTDAPVDDDAWYCWLDKAVVKVDETVQSAQRKMDEVDLEWTGLKADVTAKVEECGEVAAQAAEDAHHAKVDAQATAKALESADGSVAKAEAAAKRAVDAMLDADDSAVEASKSAFSAGESAEAAAGSATNAATSASEAATSASNAADSASAASGSASAAEQSAADASNAKAEAQTAKAGAEAAKSEAATSASNAAASATAAAKSASDAAASVGAINVIAPKHVALPSENTGGEYSIAIGQQGSITSTYSIIIGTSAIADGEPGAIAIGTSSKAHGERSVAIGSGSVATKNLEFAVGSEYRSREITHVSAPTAPTSAATKKYTDDNDAKTLNESKKYTDDNTSNALVGTVSGKLLHVEDAWPSKPLSLTIDGAYKQDGTPSPENPVPITVIENPVVKVTGMNMFDISKLTVNKSDPYGLKISAEDGYIIIQGTAIGIENEHPSFAIGWYADNSLSGKGFSVMAFGAPSTVRAYGLRTADETSIAVVTSIRNGDKVNWKIQIAISKGESKEYKPYTSKTLTLTLHAEHPYLAKLPDGTCDTIEIDKYGNATLVARVLRITVPEKNWYIEKQNSGFAVGYIPVPSGGNDVKKDLYAKSLISDRLESRREWENAPCFGVSEVLWVVPRTNQSDITSDDVAAVATGMIFYAPLATPITYNLGKLDIPSLPETISNVWTDAELTTDMSMTYKRDINIAFDNLVQAVVATAAGE